MNPNTLDASAGRLRQAWLSLTALLRAENTEREQTLPADELAATMRRGALPSFSFVIMLVFSAVIAVLGLLANSAPAIIGAMIIAPLMSPIMSLSYGMATGHRKLALAAFITILIGVALVITTGFLSVALSHLRVIGSEILSRSAPNLMDFGIALAAGGAGAFSHTRKSIANSIAGVAIAVALVPPLGVTGIGLALRAKAVSGTASSLNALGMMRGGMDIASGSFLLFLTNLIVILTVSMVIFNAEGYGRWKRSFASLMVFLAASMLLVPPLQDSLHRLWVRHRVFRIMEMRKDFLSPAQRSRVMAVHVTGTSSSLAIRIDAFVPEGRLELIRKRMEEARALVSRDVGQPVSLEYDLIPIRRVRLRVEAPRQE
jgi:uncharacterized hydrophobic protein (TIGR00271 family)